MNNRIKEFLKNHDIFKSLSDDELETVASLCEEKSFNEGDVLIKEGENSSSLFMIEEGKVSVSKKNAEANQDHIIQEFEAKTIVGAMALVGEAHRSATVKALEKVTAIVLYVEKLCKNKYKELLSHLKVNLSKNIVSRMNKANKLVVSSLTERLEQKELHSELGNVITYMMVLVFIYIYSLKIINLAKFQVISSTVISLPILIVFAIGTYMLIRKSSFSMASFGFNTKNGLKSTFQSLLITIPVMILMTGIKWMVIRTVPAFHDLSIIDVSGGLAAGVGGVTLLSVVILLVAYCTFVPVQEIIFRGGMQSSLEMFLLGKNKRLSAILISNLPFSMIHLHLSFTLTLGVYLFGVLWGYMRSMQGNLIGAIISHLILGFYGFFILSMEKIFVY